MYRKLWIAPLVAAGISCAGGDGDAPTWHADVAPLIAGNCGGCHAPGRIGPYDLTDYETASSLAHLMADAVEERTMPPWGALDTDECAPPLPWRDDLRLSDEQIATFRAWAEADAPLGDPETAAPLPEPRSTDLPRVDKVLVPDAGWVTSGTRDEFRCFVLDPEIDGTHWLTGLQVVPENDVVVHHALVFSSDPEDAQFLDELAAEDGSGTFECERGNPAPHGVELIAAWAPGAQPMRTPEGTGMPLRAGARIVVQIHYHPTGPAAEPDATSLELMWESSIPGQNVQMALVGNEGSAPELQPGANDAGDEPEFRIPAGASGHVETIIYDGVVDEIGDLVLWAAGTHMHWVGVDMKISIRRPDGSEQCLVQTPKWDFNWQRWYEYDAPMGRMPVLRPGDDLVLRCTYDNTMDNPFVREALQEQGITEPLDVFLGDETLDEMCLGVFGITQLR